MTTENMTLPERVATLEEAYKHLATKEDIANVNLSIAENAANVNLSIAENIASVNASIAENIANVNASIAELKILIANQNVLIERVQVNSTRWTIATIIAATALAVAAVKLL